MELCHRTSGGSKDNIISGSFRFQHFSKVTGESQDREILSPDFVNGDVDTILVTGISKSIEDEIIPFPRRPTLIPSSRGGKGVFWALDRLPRILSNHHRSLKFTNLLIIELVRIPVVWLLSCDRAQFRPAESFSDRPTSDSINNQSFRTRCFY